MTTTPTWADYEPRVRELVDTDLRADGVLAWLEKRDELQRDVGEDHSRLNRAKDEDTADEGAKAAYLAFVRDVLPHVAVADHELNTKLASVRDFEPPADLRNAWLDLQDQLAVFHGDNVPLETKEQELQQRYGELTGSVRVELDGATITATEAQAKLYERDRDLREPPGAPTTRRSSASARSSTRSSSSSSPFVSARRATPASPTTAR